ncbi:MAG: phosphopantothenoylcysteine decarboxylase [Candidatus Omnitrophica bacterium]|nr:phosphopantothenoylcysteine decarboxylase [Candidatus Omnitrophota bacterium]
MTSKQILLGVSGSIAAYRACDLITALRDAGFSVTVAMTKDAHHFITALTLQSFSGNEVIEDFFALPGRVKPVHIELAKRSDLILIAPASADILAKLAHGFADDVLSCTALASDAPLVIAPAMNEKMYENKFTQENIGRLKAHGAHLVAPIHGHLVCSDQGMGHLAENAAIVAAVKKALLTQRSVSAKKN